MSYDHLVGRARRRAARSTPKPTGTTGGRYTPPAEHFVTVRPAFHKVIGALQILLGLAIVLVNYVDFEDVRLLPGGHQEAYFLLGIVVAAGSLWWFGALDRTPDAEEIRRQWERQKR